VNDLGIKVVRDLPMHSDSILDLGCGILQEFDGHVPHAGDFLGVDVFIPYLEVMKNKMLTLVGELPDVCNSFLDDSFDVVLLLDVVEHLTKENGVQALAQCARIARKRVIVFTPVGYCKQEAWEAWGLPFCSYQKHLSGWSVEELEKDGYVCSIMPNYSEQEGHINSIYGVKEIK